MNYDFASMTVDEYLRFSACDRKRAFATRWYADRYAEAQFEEHGTTLYSYKCRYCNDYHLSKQNRNE